MNNYNKEHCMHKYIRSTDGTNTPGALYAQVHKKHCMHKYTKSTVCTRTQGALHATTTKNRITVCINLKRRIACIIQMEHKYAWSTACTNIPEALYAH